MDTARLKIYHQKYIQFKDQDDEEVFKFDTEDEYTIGKILDDLWKKLVNKNDHPSKP